MKLTHLILISGLIYLPFAAIADTHTVQQQLDQSLIHLNAGENDAARDLLTFLLNTNPRNFEAQVRLGGLELASGHYPMAIKHLRIAAGLDSDSPRPFIGLSLAYMHTGQMSLAMASTEEAIRRDPSKKEALKPLLDRFAEKGIANGGPLMGH